jgi:hypothetical protein
MAGSARRLALLLVISSTIGIHPLLAQSEAAPPPGSTPTATGVSDGPDAQNPEGWALPNNRRLRVRLDFMVAFTHDDAETELGLANQGRIGYAKLTFAGDLNDRFSYRLVLNPVLETQPEAACGESHYFYPNAAALSSAGPRVSCEEDGNQRVDLYKYSGLDNVVQQGPLREGFVDFRVRHDTALRFGRFIVPIGFDWEDAGSFTSKDSTRIQRINAESDFGMLLKWSRRSGARQLVGADAGVILGDGHRNTDYNYYYFVDPSSDSKSTLTALASGSYSPVASLDLRGAFKYGVTGSKVERLPNFWASKRNDDAVVASARYWPIRYAGMFGEWARYTWGPTSSAAGLLHLDRSPILKSGYYLGVEAGTPTWRGMRLSTVITREELSRDDSLVKWLASQDLYGVSMGKKDRATILRVHVDVTQQLTVGYFRNFESTPFPWVSGIAPVSGDGAFANQPTNKWGIVTRLRLP